MINDGENGKVSIIVPIYNDEKYIRLCVDSIVRQTYRNLEIILVDDASKDASLEICEEYVQNDDRVVVLHNEKNCGLSGSRERGYRCATGEWICFVDHDDSMNLCAIEQLLVTADDSTDIITGKYKNILTQYFEQYEWDADSKEEAVVLEHDAAVDALGDFIKNDIPPCLWGKIYRRDLFEKVDILKYKDKYSLIYFEDTLLTPALIKACRKLKVVNQYIYIHRIDYNSVSMSPSSLKFHIQTARAADVILNWLDEPYARHTYVKYMQGSLLTICKNWYLIGRYYNKDAALLHEMEELFHKYYAIYKKLDERKPFVEDICIRIFNVNKIFFSVVICRLWFGCIVKMRHRLLSK